MSRMEERAYQIPEHKVLSELEVLMDLQEWKDWLNGSRV